MERQKKGSGGGGGGGEVPHCMLTTFFCAISIKKGVFSRGGCGRGLW